MSSFRTRTVHALSWSFGSRFSSQLISLIFGIVLARLLLPDDFGLLAMVVVIVGFAGLLADVGLGSALIYNKNVTEKHYSTVFWMNSTIGFFLAILLAFSSSFFASFYGREELLMITIVLSFNFFIGSLALVPRAILTKKLAFREISIIELISMVISGVIAIVLAYRGFGYWSLVAQRLVERLVSTILFWVLSKWRPHIVFCYSSLKEVLNFSVFVFFTYLLQFFAVNSSNILLGKFLNAQSVGLFGKAQTMMFFPMQNISSVVGSVMFPSLSQIQDDIPRVTRTYMRLISAISLMTFPMMVGMFVVADAFVIGVLGSHWAKVSPIFQLMAFAGILASVSSATGALYLSQGKSYLQLKVNLITQPIRIIAIVLGLEWGLEGVTIGFVVGHIISSLITLHVAGNLIGVGLLAIIKHLMPTMILSLAMGLCVWQIGLMFIDLPSLSRLIIQLISGIFIYFTLMLIFKPVAYQDVITVLTSVFARKVKSKN